MKNDNRPTFPALFLIFALLTHFIGAAVVAQDGGDIVGGASGDIAGGSSVFVFRGRKKPHERSAFRNVQVVRTIQIRTEARKRRVEQSRDTVAAIITRPTPRPTPKPTNVKELEKIEGAVALIRGANKYLAQNNLSEAENGFSEAAELDPTNVEAKTGMAKIYAVRGDTAYETKDYQRAILFYEKANTFDAANADLHASLGDAYDAAEQPDKAVKSYQAALGLNDKLTALNAPLGILLAATGDFTKSVDYLSKALAASPNDVKLRDAYGLVLYKLERNEEAKNALLKAVDLNAANPESYYYLGEVYDRLDDEEKAIAAYRQAVALNPKYKEAFFDLGVAYYNRGQYAEAAQNYNQAIRLQGDYLEARVNLADTYRQMAENGEKNRYADAINQYQVIVSLLARPTSANSNSSGTFNPNEADIFSKFGYCLGNNKEWANAVNYMNKAVAKQPDAVNYTNLAWALNGSKNFPLAAQAAEEAVKLNANFPAALLNLGNAQAETGKFAEAERSFQQALKLKKDWADALNNLGVVYGRTNEWKKAFAAHRAAVQAEPNSVAAHFNLGFAAVELGDRKTAEQERDVLLKLNVYKAKTLNDKIKNSAFDKSNKNKNNY